jgi:hypothetical protein
MTASLQMGRQRDAVDLQIVDIDTESVEHGPSLRVGPLDDVMCGLAKLETVGPCKSSAETARVARSAFTPLFAFSAACSGRSRFLLPQPRLQCMQLGNKQPP